MAIMIRAILYIMIVCLFASCTADEPYSPSLEKYSEDASLIINVAKKFSEERDPVVLRRVVLAMQATRTMNCIDYNGECKLYNEFEVLALNLSQSGTFAQGAQAKLRDKLDEIIKAVNEGKKKLQK